MQTAYANPHVGDHVRHPLWPELGTGTVQTASNNPKQPGLRVGIVHWSTGQTSTHNLGVLKIIEHKP